MRISDWSSDVCSADLDLVAGAENIIVAMSHASKDGASKILNKCSLPLTGVNCVKLVVTDLAVLELKEGKFHLLERAPGVSVEEIKSKTDRKSTRLNSSH